MEIQLSQEPVAVLAQYSRISIAFEVETVLDVRPDNHNTGGFVLSESCLNTPYAKDYDALDGGPTAWPMRFDLSNWGVIMAWLDDRPVGGIAIAHRSPEVDMLEGRSDLGLIWDVRVQPELRGQGIGSDLFRTAEKWAEERGCRQLKVETQNINLAANRFYARQGCVLRKVNRLAYKDLPEEIQLLWYKELRP
jgi:GNAT superfamily N-acetyltransferase